MNKSEKLDIRDNYVNYIKSDGRLSVGFLSNVFFPVTNGVVHSLHLLVKGLKANGIDTFILTSKHPNFNGSVINKYKIDYEVFTIPSIYLKKFDYCIPNPLGFFSFKKIVLDKQMDILQLNHPFIIYNIAKKIRDIKKEVKIVFVFHTQYDLYHNYIKFIPFKVYSKFIWNHLNDVISNVDVVVVPSKSMIDKIKQNIDSKYYSKIVYIPNPVDTDFINSVDLNAVNYLRDELGIKDKFVIGFVGRIEEEKNIKKLIDFFIRYFQNKEDIVLLVVGGGTLLGLLKQTYSSYKNIIFTGKIEFEKIGMYYKLIDVFVSLSLTEVKPLAYIEALASGIPVIAFKTVGADDLIIDNYNGFLIEYNKDYELNLYRIINNLYENRTILDNLKTNCIESSKEYHYFEISKRYVNLYLDLI